MLKKRLKIANRGHKLLNDKQVELVKTFIGLVTKNKQLREEVENELPEALRRILLAKAVMADKALEEAIMLPTQQMLLEVSIKNLMSVSTPVFSRVNQSQSYSQNQTQNQTQDFSGFSYGFANTTGELDLALETLQDVAAKMIELAQIEKACQLMAGEIEKTRRRVNVLEYVLVPQLEDTIKYIGMKLDENDRGSRVRLMKIRNLYWDTN